MRCSIKRIIDRSSEKSSCLDINIREEFSARQIFQKIQRQGSGKEKEKGRRLGFVVKSLLEYWIGNGYKLIFLTLTLPHVILRDELSYLVGRLKERIERVWGFRELEHVRVLTDEGNGVVHVILTYKGCCRFWVSRRWLVQERSRLVFDKLKRKLGSEEFEKIIGEMKEKTGGDVVLWVRKVRKEKKDVKRLVNYLANQKLLRRTSWSWGRWKRNVGFSLRKGFRYFRRVVEVEGRELFELWDRLLRYGKVKVREGMDILLDDMRCMIGGLKIKSSCLGYLGMSKV